MAGTFAHLLAAGDVVQVRRWDQAPEPWQVFLILALVFAAAGVCYLLEPRGERPWLRVPLAVVRALVIIVAVGILFRPLESTETLDVKDGQVVVVVDTSRSMGFLDRERDEGVRDATAKALGVSVERLRELDRLARVKLALRKDGGELLRRFARKNRVRLFTFDSTRKRLAEVDRLDAAPAAGAAAVPADAADGPDQVAAALAALEGTAAEGQATALGDALQRILTDLRSERVAALVLLTDGRSNAGSVSAEAVAGRFKRKDVPIYAVGVGDPEPPRDLALDDFRAPDVSLAGDVMSGAVLVRAQGYPEAREVRVRITLDDQPLHEALVTVGGEQPDRDVEFQAKLPRAGEYTLEARVDPDPDELTADNNRVMRRIRVIDEKLRVLYIEGYPRWEYRYLKNALVRDSHMEVQVLLASADPEFVQESSPHVPALRRLPPPDELLKYHVVVLGDVSPEARDRRGEPVFGPGALDALRELVRERGGGLLMISGEQSAPRAWVGTPLEDVLPVVIDPNAGRGMDFSRPWRPRLTRDGYDSPLMRLEPAEEVSRALWDAQLPDLYWYVQVERAKPQAQVLAVHPRDKNQHGPFPVAAWHRYGAGTSFWVGFDETWRWRPSVGDKYQYRFFGQILRFLSLQSFSRAKRFFVSTDKTQYDLGEEVQLHAEVRDREKRPDDPGQEVQLEAPDGSQQTLVLKPTERAGRYVGTYKPVQVGPYRARIDPGAEGAQSDAASRVFEVRLPRLELQDPRMDQEGLERVAEASGGKFLRLDGLDAIPDEVQPRRAQVRIGKTETELWDKPWVFALFFGLILVEWIGRKVNRML